MIGVDANPSLQKTDAVPGCSSNECHTVVLAAVLFTKPVAVYSRSPLVGSSATAGPTKTTFPWG